MEGLLSSFPIFIAVPLEKLGLENAVALMRVTRSQTDLQLSMAQNESGQVKELGVEEESGSTSVGSAIKELAQDLEEVQD